MRKLLLAVGALLALAGAYVAISLDAYLNENRAWLEDQAELLLERPIEIGRVGVELGLGIALRLDDFVIGEHPAFGTEPALRARSVEVGLRAWPALFGRYEVRNVDVHSPVIRIVRTDDGLSVSTLGGDATRTQQEARQGAARALESEGQAELALGIAARIALGLANIQDGTLHFVDRTQDPPLELVWRGIRAEAADLQLGRPVAVEMRAELSETLGLPPELLVDGPILLKARTVGAIEDPTMSLSLDATGATIAYSERFAKPAATPLQLSMRVRGSEDNAALLEDGELHLDSALVRFAGTVQLAQPFRYDVRLESQRVAMEAWNALLPVLNGVALSGEADVDVQVAGSPDETGLPLIKGTLTLHDLGVLSVGLPELAKLSGTVQLESNQALLPEGQLELAGSTIELALRIDDYDNPRFTFEASSEELRAESLTLNRGETRWPETLRAVTLTGTATLPASGPVADVSLTSLEGRLHDIDYRELRAELHYRDHVVTIESGDFRALGGAIQVSGHLDTQDDPAPAFSLDVTSDAVRLEQYLDVRFPTKSRVIEGELSGELSLAARGTEWNVIKQFLTGGGTLALERGTLYGVNLASSVLGGMGNVPLVGKLVSSPLRTAYPIALGEPNTKFVKISSPIEIKDGRITSPNLEFTAEDYSIRAEGNLSLDGDVAIAGIFVAGSALTQELVGTINPLRRLTGRGGQLEIPFTLTGPATQLRVLPDVDYIARSLTTGLMTDTLGQLTGGRLGSKKNEEESSTR